MKSLGCFIGLLLISAWLSGCNSKGPAQNVVWCASKDFGDKPGNGIELQIHATGAIEGRFFILAPDKPHDFSTAIGIPMKISRSGPKEILFSVDFGQGQIDRMRLTFPNGLEGSTSEGVLQNQRGDDAPVRFIFRRLVHPPLR